MTHIVVEELTHADEVDAQALQLLVPQMTQNPTTPLNVRRLTTILESGTRLWVARDDSRIIGVGVLGKVEQLVGTKYWLEDVVIDGEYRSQGLARAIVGQLLAHIPEVVYSVNLTSKSARPEAQAWYQRLGFEHKSNVYRLKR